jgi:DNA-directed RNA polymerase specialized sigma24 family protein
MSQNVMDLIDSAAHQFYTTKDNKYFDEFVKCATPVIKQMIYKACAGSSWDVDELFSILLADMWRLFNRWEPEEGKKFHWLVLRQLKNKTINYLHMVRGRPHRVCNVCNTKQKGGASTCIKCGAPLRLPDIIVSGTFETAYNAYHPDYLEDIANKQLVDKLLVQVRGEDPKTYKILQLMLEGHSKSEISREINLAQNAMNNRIKKCRRIINRLVKEPS